jgi:dihydroneopterin aldolase
MDRVFIHGLRLACRVGITEEERRQPQGVIVDVDMLLDLSRAAKSRDLGDTVDYREARLLITGVMSKGQFRLLETVAEEVAVLLMAKFEIERVNVKICKEKYSSSPAIGIEVERERRQRSR